MNMLFSHRGGVQGDEVVVTLPLETLRQRDVLTLDQVKRLAPLIEAEAARVRAQLREAESALAVRRRLMAQESQAADPSEDTAVAAEATPGTPSSGSS